MTNTSTPTGPPMSRAEVNRRMVAGELTPTAARDATLDLYRADPAAAARLVAPDEESGASWDAPAPDLAPKVGRRPGKAGARRTRTAVAASAGPDHAAASDDPDHDVTTLGAYLTSLREEKGLTRTQLGSAIGARSDIIKAYEDGRRRPSSFMAPRLAEALGVEPDFLRALVEEQGPSRATSRKGTRRAATSKGKATGKTRGKATSPRTTATKKGARTVPARTAPATVKGQDGMAEGAMPGVAKMPHLAKSRDQVAEMVGVSHGYVSGARRVKKEAPEAFEGLRAVAVSPVLPRLAWQDTRYRIVQLRESAPLPHDGDDEDGVGPRPYVIEREDGHDALGATRWQQIGAGDEGAWMRATQHLMGVLAEGGHTATGRVGGGA